MDEYIKREDLIKHLRGACIAKYPLSFSYGIFASADEISKLPPADVVPKSEVLEMQKEQLGRLKEIKSEVERVTVEYEAMRGAANSYKMHYEQAKAEVAREIFAEIERLCDAHLYWNNCSIIQRDDIAELKKKYIPQECPTCKHMVSCEPNVFGSCEEYEEENKNEKENT